jgi:hypothetical protein
MPDSNFAELRRVRTEMSAEAGHDAHRFLRMLDGVRERYRHHLVDHGTDAEHGSALESPNQKTWNEESAPAAL